MTLNVCMCDSHNCLKLENLSKVFFVLFSSYFQRSMIMIGCGSSFPSPRRHKKPLEDWLFYWKLWQLVWQPRRLTILLKQTRGTGDDFSQIEISDSLRQERALTHILKARRSCWGRRPTCRCTRPSTSRPRPWRGRWSRRRPRRRARPRTARRRWTRRCTSHLL